VVFLFRQQLSVTNLFRRTQRRRAAAAGAA